VDVRKDGPDWPATDRSRDPFAHPPSGPGEPPLGLCPDRRGASEARDSRRRNDDPDPAPDCPSWSCPTTDRADVDRVPPGASGWHHRVRTVAARRLAGSELGVSTRAGNPEQGFVASTHTCDTLSQPPRPIDLGHGARGAADPPPQHQESRFES
jgi:hypothetical protein